MINLVLQLTFLKANGNIKSEFEELEIAKSGLEEMPLETLKAKIVTDLNNELYENPKDRISSYWVLSKVHSQDLIPDFRRWLGKEIISDEPSTVFQILIALGNLGEPVWNDDRKNSYSYDETQLNMRDAKAYLSNHS